MRHTADWWAERVEDLGRSGDAGGIARRHGVRAQTLLWWRWKLGRPAPREATPRLLPVVVDTAAHVPRARVDEVELFVEIGGTRMTMRGAVTAEHLAAIVSASTRTC
jgi:transposase-like protein